LGLGVGEMGVLWPKVVKAVTDLLGELAHRGPSLVSLLPPCGAEFRREGSSMGT